MIKALLGSDLRSMRRERICHRRSTSSTCIRSLYWSATIRPELPSRQHIYGRSNSPACCDPEVPQLNRNSPEREYTSILCSRGTLTYKMSFIAAKLRYLALFLDLTLNELIIFQLSHCLNIQTEFELRSNVKIRSK